MKLITKYIIINYESLKKLFKNNKFNKYYKYILNLPFYVNTLCGTPS